MKQLLLTNQQYDSVPKFPNFELINLSPQNFFNTPMQLQRISPIQLCDVRASYPGKKRGLSVWICFFDHYCLHNNCRLCRNTYATHTQSMQGCYRRYLQQSGKKIHFFKEKKMVLSCQGVVNEGFFHILDESLSFYELLVKDRDKRL